MLYAGAAEESLAVLQVVQALLVTLQRKEVLGYEDISSLMNDATAPVRESTFTRKDGTVRLLDQLREEVLKG